MQWDAVPHAAHDKNATAGQLHRRIPFLKSGFAFSGEVWRFIEGTAADQQHSGHQQNSIYFTDIHPQSVLTSRVSSPRGAVCVYEMLSAGCKQRMRQHWVGLAHQWPSSEKVCGKVCRADPETEACLTAGWRGCQGAEGLPPLLQHRSAAHPPLALPPQFCHRRICRPGMRPAGGRDHQLSDLIAC